MDDTRHLRNRVKDATLTTTRCRGKEDTNTRLYSEQPAKVEVGIAHSLWLKRENVGRGGSERLKSNEKGRPWRTCPRSVRIRIVESLTEI